MFGGTTKLAPKMIFSVYHRISSKLFICAQNNPGKPNSGPAANPHPHRPFETCHDSSFN